jgi:putative hemolysin
MGSSGHIGWIVAASICGALYLLFDTARYFVQQVGPVRLRRFTGDLEEEGRSRWVHYDAQNFALVSGSLLQLSLIGGLGATVLALSVLPIGTAALLATLIWAALSLLWKFVLALVPEEASELMLRGLIPVSNFFFYLFWPLLYPLRSLIQRMDGQDEEGEEEEEVSDEAVQAYIDVGEEEGILQPAEGKLLQSIVDFGDRLAREIMTPRIDVQAFDATRPVEELAQMFSDTKYSRIPIYQGSIDQIIGFVHIKEVLDVVLKQEKKAVTELARPAYVVSETKRVAELLREFQSEHIQVAVVVDEYGGTAGIVTIEDVIEEIVGEIADEHEEEEPTIADLGDGSYMVSGALRVQDLEEKLDADLAGDDYETVAGLIFTTLGRVPNVGSVVTKNGYRFEVDRADRRRIYRVKVSRDPEWRADGEKEEE